LFDAAVGRVIVASSSERLRQALHIDARVFGRVRVLIALAVVEFLHQLGGRVAQVQRDGVGDGSGYVVAG